MLSKNHVLNQKRFVRTHIVYFNFKGNIWSIIIFTDYEGTGMITAKCDKEARTKIGYTLHVKEESGFKSKTINL